MTPLIELLVREVARRCAALDLPRSHGHCHETAAMAVQVAEELGLPAFLAVTPVRFGDSSVPSLHTSCIIGGTVIASTWPGTIDVTAS